MGPDAAAERLGIQCKVQPMCFLAISSPWSPRASTRERQHLIARQFNPGKRARGGRDWTSVERGVDLPHQPWCAHGSATDHDAVRCGLLQAALGILRRSDVAVGDHRES